MPWIQFLQIGLSSIACLSSKTWDVNSSNTSWHLSVQSYLRILFKRTETLFLNKFSFSTDMKLYALYLLADFDRWSKNQSPGSGTAKPSRCWPPSFTELFTNRILGKEKHFCAVSSQIKTHITLHYTKTRKQSAYSIQETQNPTWVNKCPMKKMKISYNHRQGSSLINVGKHLWINKSLSTRIFLFPPVVFV